MSQNPNDPVAGDLIQLDPAVFGPRSEIPVFSTWGKKGGIDFEICRFRGDEHALVLEDLRHQNGNGCRILMRSGMVGWINVKVVRRVK